MRNVLKASSLLFGFPYILLSIVTIVSAPIIMSGRDFAISDFSILSKRTETSSTFCSAVSSTNSEKPGKLLISRFSLNVDGYISTLRP